MGNGIKDGNGEGEAVTRDTLSRSWFAVFNNPSAHGYPGEPGEVCGQLMAEWVDGSSTRSGAWAYCVSADGLHHVHMVLEDKKLMRWSAVKKSYAAGMHFKATRGTKEQAEDYIYKRGGFGEKGEEVLAVCTHGEIRGHQGARNDIRAMYDLVKAGCSDFEIVEENPAYLMHLDRIAACREMLRYEEFKDRRRLDMHVEFWFGAPGTGKTSGILDRYGDSHVYVISDYRHPWDNYRGEDVVLFDDFDCARVDISLLLRWLDIYPLQLPCRYNNKTACYTKVFFTSNIPPDGHYQYVQREQPSMWEALCRRIHAVREFRDDGQVREYASVKEYTRGHDVPQEGKFYTPPPECVQEVMELFGSPVPGKDRKEGK